MENWLTPLKTIVDISVLIQSIGLTPETQKDFWKNMLATLHGEPSPLTGMTQDSLMDYIEKNCDFVQRDHGSSTDPIFISKLYDGIVDLIEGGEDEYWNESVQKLIQYIIDNFDNNNDNILLPLDTKEHSITIADLKNSDAGYNFPIGERANEEEWVHPWWNIDDKNYDEVRKKDEVLEILKNDTAMQYTREAYDQAEGEDLIEKWLRLLMPQYGRRVEIEDLDRNFWTIAQVISAISNYLFGTDSPIPKTLQGLTREVSELWENVLYLWTEIAVINQTAKSDIRFVHIPLPPRSNENCRHYDGLDTQDIGTEGKLCTITYDSTSTHHLVTYPTTEEDFAIEVEKRLSYLCDQYSEQDIVVLPFIRFDNYKHNYYSGVYYPGFFIYYQAGKEWEFIPVYESYQSKNYPVVISLRNEIQDGTHKRFSPYIYGTNQNYQSRIGWTRPFSRVHEIILDGPQAFCYGNLRIVPFFKNIVRNDEGKIIINSGTVVPESNLSNVLLVYDAARQLVNDGQVNTAGLIGYYAYGATNHHFAYSIADASTQLAFKDELTVIDYDLYREGYYMGETISWRVKTAEISEKESAFEDNAYVLKVGNYLPDSHGGFTMASRENDGNYNFTSMYGNVTVYNASTSDVKYYRFRWDTYNKANDGTPDDQVTSNAISYTANPDKKSSNYPTQDRLDYDGFVAAVNFIKANIGTVSKNPCFIATCVGLTPWTGYGRLSTQLDAYWDVALMSNIYFFIPSAYGIIGVEHDTETIRVDDYMTVYNNFNAVQARPASSTDSIPSGVQMLKYNTADLGAGESPVTTGIIKDSNNKEIGKIVMCKHINQYEAYQYDDYFNNCPDLYLEPRWRQFFITNDSENNSCTRIDVNGGYEHGGITKYSASFSTDFKGYVKYFDVRRYNASQTDKPHNPIYKSSISQVSYAPIVIDADGYRQSGEGKYASAKSSAVAFDSRTNVAYNHNYTSFPVMMDRTTHDPSPEDIINKITNISNQNVSYFHGTTSLYGGALGIYKV